MEFKIITGLSGAGKSQSIKIFEDMGFFCVDNLPPALLPKFAELCSLSGEEMSKVALVIDIRGGLFFKELLPNLEKLRQLEIDYQIIFLEAADEVLVKRFKETRRQHPLSPGGSILDGIQKERQILEELRGQAAKIIDTSELSNQLLNNEILSLWGKPDPKSTLSLTFLSFGYKYGIPLDTDLVIDVRFLPNPFYVQELKNLTGENEEVRLYVLEKPESQKFLHLFSELLSFLLPNYIKEGKKHLTAAIGCTGGKHRSVTLAIVLGKLFEEKYDIQIRHRDICK